MRDVETSDPSSVRLLPTAAHVGILRPLGLIVGVNGVNLLVSTFVHDAPSVGVALEALGVVVGVVSLLFAALLVAAPRLAWARLEGTTLVTRHLVGVRRVDLTAARVRITNHQLLAKDGHTGRSISQPLLSAGAPLPPADLLALADAVQRGDGRTAGALRDLATNEPLRRSLGGRKNRLVPVMYVLALIGCGLTVFALAVRLIDVAS